MAMHKKKALVTTTCVVVCDVDAIGKDYGHVSILVFEPRLDGHDCGWSRNLLTEACLSIAQIGILGKDAMTFAQDRARRFHIAKHDINSSERPKRRGIGVREEAYDPFELLA